MSIITVEKVSHNFGGQEIFREISFSVERNSRIGLVGRNGSGKSTLFQIMTGRLIPREGSIHIARKTKIAYLTQDPELNEANTLYQEILTSRPDYVRLSGLLIEAEKEVSQFPTEENIEKLENLQSEFDHIDGYHLQTEIKLVLTNLNFPESVWEQSISLFSGGEKTRIQLAKFLLQPFDIMLLDEPTNHLDLGMIFWLEKYLKNIGKPYVIISHDRNFLDNTITKIAEISDQKVNIFKSNYSNYRLEKQQLFDVQMNMFKRQQKFIEETEDFIRRNMAGQKVSQARSRQKMLARLDIIDKPQLEKTAKIEVKAEQRSGNDVYILENMELGFPGKVLANRVDLRIHYRDKIAILGRNGCGKTTLLRLFNQEINPLSGKAKMGASLKTGYYDQEHIALAEDKTVMATIWDMVPGEPRGYVLSYLAQYGFKGDDVEKQVSVLSGGEKARLYLASLLHARPNFLLLDEPTNHLDLEMISNLEIALRNYDGTIAFISHDRHFIENVATRKWFFDDNRIFETKKSLKELFFETKKISKNSETAKIKDTVKKINPIILEKLLDQIHQTEKKLTGKVAELEQLELGYSDGSVYQDKEKFSDFSRKVDIIKQQRNELTTQLEILEAEYLELAEIGE